MAAHIKSYTADLRSSNEYSNVDVKTLCMVKYCNILLGRVWKFDSR